MKTLGAVLLALTLSGCKANLTQPTISPVDQVIGKAAQIEVLVARTASTLVASAQTAQQGGVLSGANFTLVCNYAKQVANANDTSVQETRKAIGTGTVGTIPEALLAESAIITHNPKIDNPAIMGIVQTLLDLAQQIEDMKLAPPAK